MSSSKALKILEKQQIFLINQPKIHIMVSCSKDPPSVLGFKQKKVDPVS